MAHLAGVAMRSACAGYLRLSCTDLLIMGMTASNATPPTVHAGCCGNSATIGSPFKLVDVEKLQTSANLAGNNESNAGGGAMRATLQKTQTAVRNTPRSTSNILPTIKFLSRNIMLSVFVLLLSFVA